MDRKFLPKTFRKAFVGASFILASLRNYGRLFFSFISKILTSINEYLLKFQYYKIFRKKVGELRELRFFKFLYFYWNRYKRFSYIGLVLLVVLLGFQLYRANRVGAWWNNDWHYRKPITINYVGTTELNDFQVKVPGTALLETTLNTAGKLQNDCSDLRFTDSSGKKLDYWIEETSSTDDLVDCTATDYDVWVRVSKLQTGDNTFYVYYGNENAQSGSNGENTFDFFDGFTSGSLDIGKWTATGAYTTIGGELSITTGSVYTNNKVGTNPQDHTFEVKTKWSGTDAEYSGLQIADANFVAGNNANSNKLAFKMTANPGSNLQSFGADGTAASYNIVSIGAEYTQTLGNRYITGFDFISTTNINYFVNDTSYTSLQVNSYSGTWNGAYYLWLGYFFGSTSGTTDVDDMSSDWVRVRKYASTSPSTPTSGIEQTQEDYSTSGGKPVAYWPLTSDTCDNTGCMNVIKPVDTGKPPILHMDFEEGKISSNQCPDGSVAAVCDISGNGNSGTANGTMTNSDYVTGKVGTYALDFDGSNDYLLVADDPSLRGSNELTLSAWVYPQTLDDYDIIASYGDNGSGNLRFHWGTGTNDHFRFDWSADGTVYGQNENSATLSLNTWSFISTTFDNGRVIMYINGEIVDDSVSTITSLYESPGNLYVGRRDGYATSRLFDGYIDDFKMYNYARTPEQIKQDYNNTKAYFGGGSSTPQFENTNTTSPGNPHVGSTKQVMSFDGVDDNIGPLDSSLIKASSGSVSLWASVKGSQSSPAYIFSLPDGGNNNRIYISYSSGGYIVSCRLADGTTIGTYTMEDSTLYNLICTWDGTSASFYVNGEDQTTTSTFSGFTTTTTGFYLGSLSGTNQFFKGQLSGVKIFDYALSADEVKNQYNAGLDGVGTGVNTKF